MVCELQTLTPVKLPKPVAIPKEEPKPNDYRTIQDDAETFDVVYFSDEHRATRFKYLKRLDKDEQIQRRLAHGMEIGQNRHFPPPFLKQDGFKTFCSISCRKFYGANFFLTENDYVYSQVDFTLIKPGLVGGNIKPGFLESDELQRFVEMDYLRDSTSLANCQSINQEDIEQQLTQRYLITVAHMLRIPNPSKMPIQELLDLVKMASLTEQAANIPDIDTWKAVHGLNSDTPMELPAVTIGRDQDFDRVVSSLKSRLQTKR